MQLSKQSIVVLISCKNKNHLPYSQKMILTNVKWTNSKSLSSFVFFSVWNKSLFLFRYFFIYFHSLMIFSFSFGFLAAILVNRLLVSITIIFSHDLSVFFGLFWCGRAVNLLGCLYLYGHFISSVSCYSSYMFGECSVCLHHEFK